MNTIRSNPAVAGLSAAARPAVARAAVAGAAAQPQETVTLGDRVHGAVKGLKSGAEFYLGQILEEGPLSAAFLVAALPIGLPTVALVGAGVGFADAPPSPKAPVDPSSYSLVNQEAYLAEALPR